MPDSTSSNPLPRPLRRSSGTGGTIASAVFALVVTAIVSHAHQPAQVAAAPRGGATSDVAMTAARSDGNDPSVPLAAETLRNAAPAPAEMAPSF